MSCPNPAASVPSAVRRSARCRRRLAVASALVCSVKSRWSRVCSWLRSVPTTIVPLTLYFKGHLVKVEMALVKGKQLHDKREHVKEREAKREIDRATSRRR